MLKKRILNIAFCFASILLFLNFFLATFTIVNNYKLTPEYHYADVPNYLNLGLRIANGKEGVIITDGNRHPLYSMILSLFAEKDIKYFIKSKLVSMIIGNFFLLTVFLLFLVKKKKVEAILILFILSNNVWFQWHSADVRCEGLYTALLFLAWYLFYSCFKGKLSFFVPGLIVGAAFLSKYSALLMGYSFFITYWVIYKSEGIKWQHTKKILFFILGFLVVSWPLFKWNYQKYDKPLFNVNTTHYMWFDNITELREHPEYSSKIYKVFLSPPKTMPTMKTFFQEHDIKHISIRLIKGIYGQYFELRKALAEKYYILYIFIFIMGLIVILGRYNLRQVFASKREIYIFSIILFLLNYLSLSWIYAVFIDTRHIHPIIPIVYIVLIDFMVSLSRETPLLRAKLWERGRFQTALVTLFCLFVVFISIKSIQTAKIENPFSAQHVNKDKLLSRLRDF